MAITYEKSMADNIDLVDFQISNIKYKVQNKQREKVIGINFIDIIKYRTINDKNNIYRDIMEYSKDAPFGDSSGRPTNAHETVHGINAEYINKDINLMLYIV